MRLLRQAARRIARVTENSPAIHRALRRGFLTLPVWLRGEQMIYDHLRKLVRTRRDHTFVVVGANDGITNDPIHPFAKKYHWRGILIEPVPMYYEQLVENSRGLAVKAVNVAVHATLRAMPFYYLEDCPAHALPAFARGVGSFDRAKVISSAAEVHGVEDHLRQIQVPCKRLDEIVVESQLTTVNIVVIDAEGYDHEIVPQIRFDEWKTHTVIFEHKHLPAGALESIRETLTARGFHCRRDKYDVLASREAS